MTDTAPPQSAASPATAPTRKPRQCNADYRWTVPKVKAFMLALEKCGRVAEAAAAVGMSRQAAYALRKRLNSPAFREAFEGARRVGLRARAAASRARVEAQRSQWEGPGLAALDHLRGAPSQAGTRRAQADTRAAQAATLHAQAVARFAQAVSAMLQADASATQADADLHKPTKDPLDSVTGVTPVTGR